jgi:hypothetical protein
MSHKAASGARRLVSRSTSHIAASEPAKMAAHQASRTKRPLVPSGAGRSLLKTAIVVTEPLSGPRIIVVRSSMAAARRRCHRSSAPGCGAQGGLSRRDRPSRRRVPLAIAASHDTSPVIVGIGESADPL